MSISLQNRQRFIPDNPIPVGLTVLTPEHPRVPVEHSRPASRGRRAAEGQGDQRPAADVRLGQRLGAAMESGYAMVEVPANSSLAPALALYRQLWSQPPLQAWLTSKGLETGTLRLHKDFIQGYVVRDGVRTPVRFSTSDASGWWQVSAPLRALREVLDPRDRGLTHLADGEQWVPRHLVLQAFGIELPMGIEQANQLERQLRTQGLSMPPARARSMAADLAQVQLTLGELEERPRLADQLERLITDLPDTTPWDGVQPADGSPTLRQIVEQKGLGTPHTVGEVRNVIQWLRTTLPPAPPLGNYAGFMDWTWAPGQLSASDKATLAALANAQLGGASAEGFDYLKGHGLEALQADPAGHLHRLLDSPEALDLGERWARSVNWYGTFDIGTTVPKAVCQQMVIAAIKLHADPQAPGKPGQVAGYDLYQPANMGRTFTAIRRDLENHLIHQKGLDSKLAILAAHIGLAQAAPEFLVRDVPDAIHMGTPAWMELRLGCGMVDNLAPGTSRAMDEEQISAITVLGPTSEAQATLMRLLGLRIITDWAVLNGVIPRAPDGEYSAHMIQAASAAFQGQREDVSRAFTQCASGLPTRRSVAIAELLKVFPGVAASRLEGMTVQLADAGARRNMRVSEPRTRSLVETYMTGDLTPGKWVLTSDLPQAPARAASSPYQPRSEVIAPVEKRNELDARIRRLPALDGLLKKAVDEHRSALKSAYATQLKLRIAELPLADRKLLELGNVELFTLRGETGEIQAKETDAHRDAAKYRQGTLIRAEHGTTVSYYEVFAKGPIVKRTDLPSQLVLGGVVERKRVPAPWGVTSVPIVRGTALAIDVDAYAKGSDPRSTREPSKVIVEKLGATLPGVPRPEGFAPDDFVPDSYSSSKTADIVTRITQGNFYESQETMLARAKGVLPLEQHREAVARDHGILLGLVPFVGAYQEFAAGNIGSGLFSLALDVGGVALSAAGRARSLIRAGRALAQAPVAGVIRRLAPTLSPLVPKTAWVKPVASFSDKAFDFVREGVLFTSAALNPFDGYPQMVSAATKGLVKLPALVAGGATRLGKSVPHLITAEEKMRCYLMAAAGQAAPSRPPAAGVAGTSQGIDVHATGNNGRWYAIDPRSGRPFGTPLSGFQQAR
ncbi:MULTISPECIES: hypothetical protein [unclassified Pseudomonas]|uniref:Uncharacterized protein n=1 Tax=Pseudomonas gorinensis TaxID=3240790 RepID=A0ACA7P6G8_9PSED|nr:MULTISPECIES: hypothetical protein [unclassified Pseudomonas]AHC35600.1 hypothetical protein U771_15375 [Pseudomonas sp. TKP]MBL1309639.1 hypothetical protein [Pseudomonas sp.]WLI54202.1 hypothetical protein PSH63_16260 [Pseudomonas sp. FP833]SDZ67080.1 hypothetical protein SAMN05444743_12847 [Pseudomonas sp. PDC86]